MTSSTATSVLSSNSVTSRSEYGQNRSPHLSPVKVVVRVRPFMPTERGRLGQDGVQCYEDGKVIQCLDGVSPPMSFDNVFGPHASQTNVFDECGIKDLIERTLKGYVCTVCAFGPTGTGKTHTLFGSLPTEFKEDDTTVVVQSPEIHSPIQNQQQSKRVQDHFGIAQHALAYLFDLVHSYPRGSIVLSASYMEVYNEQVFDLLNYTQDPLTIRQNTRHKTRQDSFYAELLKVAVTPTLASCMSILQQGLAVRKEGAHHLNDHSSRSHLIMTLYVETRHQDTIHYGRLHIVDLAGNEKVKNSGAQGDTLVQTMSINKSLLCFGNCISALADPKKRLRHVPYRDSALTKLLSDSLKGNGYLLLIATASPSLMHLQDTLRTLRYASRAKKMTLQPCPMFTDPREQRLNLLEQKLKVAHEEIAYLRSLMNQPASNIKETTPLPVLQPIGKERAPSQNSISIESESSWVSVLSDPIQQKKKSLDVNRTPSKYEKKNPTPPQSTPLARPNSCSRLHKGSLHPPLLPSKTNAGEEPHSPLIPVPPSVKPPPVRITRLRLPKYKSKPRKFQNTDLPPTTGGLPVPVSHSPHPLSQATMPTTFSETENAHHAHATPPMAIPSANRHSAPPKSSPPSFPHTESGKVSTHAKSSSQYKLSESPKKQPLILPAISTTATPASSLVPKQKLDKETLPPLPSRDNHEALFRSYPDMALHSAAPGTAVQMVGNQDSSPQKPFISPPYFSPPQSHGHHHYPSSPTLNNSRLSHRPPGLQFYEKELIDMNTHLKKENDALDEEIQRLQQQTQATQPSFPAAQQYQHWQKQKPVYKYGHRK